MALTQLKLDREQAQRLELFDDLPDIIQCCGEDNDTKLEKAIREKLGRIQSFADENKCRFPAIKTLLASDSSQRLFKSVVTSKEDLNPVRPYRTSVVVLADAITKIANLPQELTNIKQALVKIYIKSYIKAVIWERIQYPVRSNIDDYNRLEQELRNVTMTFISCLYLFPEELDKDKFLLRFQEELKYYASMLSMAVITESPKSENNLS